MKPAPLRYHAPTELPEALDLVAEHGRDAAPLAGGQSLMPTLNMRAARPSHLIDLNGLPGLTRIAEHEEALHVGALVRHKAFEAYRDGDPTRALLARAAPFVGHPPIRERGTFVGSIALSAPAAEWCVVAILLGGVVVAESASGRRSIPIDGFAVGAFATARRPDEILTEVRLDRLAPAHRTAFVEQARTVGDFPLVCAAAAVRTEGGTLAAVRVSLGGVAPTATRLRAMETALEGAPGDDPDALSRAATSVTDIQDVAGEPYASADYKRHLGSVLARRAVQRAIGEP